jgi:CHAT domain-containing protein/Tfp pilus assembly protein PilF
LNLLWEKSMAATRLGAFALLLFTSAGARAGEPLTVRLTEDFATDTRSAYEVSGEVGWQPGRLKLGGEARLSRSLSLGPTTEVRAAVRLAGADGAELTLELAGAGLRAAAALRRQRGKLLLVCLAKQPAEAALPDEGGGKAPETVWELRCRLHYGVLRAKAWPAGKAEPADWLTARYSGTAGWQPATVALASGKTVGGEAVRLEVRSTPPVRPFSPAQRQLLLRDRALNSEGIALYRKGNFAEALQRLRQAVAVRSELYGPEHPATADSHHGLGVVLRANGDHTAARRAFERALAIRTRVLGPDHPNTAFTESNLATAQQDLGDYAAARGHLERALQARRRVLGPAHADTSESLNLLGGLLWDQGELTAARACFEEALAIRRKENGSRHLNTATVLNNLGLLRYSQQEFAAARSCLEQALDIYEQIQGADHLWTAMAHNNLGLVLESQGEHQAARQHHLKALDVRKRKLPPQHPDLAMSLLNLATVQRSEGDFKAARDCYEQALAIWTKVFGPEHPRTALTLTSLGVLRAMTGDRDGAWRALADSSAVYARLLDRLLAGAAVRQHREIAGHRRHHHDLLLNLAEQASELSESRRAELLACVLAWKAGSAQALLARHEALADSGGALAAPLAELRAVRGELAQATLRGPGRRAAADHQAALQRLRDRQDKLERDLAGRVAGLSVLQEVRRASLADLAGQLPAHAVLVELVRYHGADFQKAESARRWRPARYAALLLHRSEKAPFTIRLVPLGEAAAIDRAVRDWRKATQRGAADAAVENALRAKVWAPLAAALPEGTGRLLIAPDGQLALLPFEAVRLEDGRYLVERFQVSYLSTGRDLLPRPLPAEQASTAVVFADPDYDAPAKAGAATVPTAENPLAGKVGIFRSLPGFAREADAVTALLRGQKGWSVKLRRGPQASEEALARAKRPRLLYCVTHGFFLSDALLTAEKGAGLRELELVEVGAKVPRLLSPADHPGLRSGLVLAGANHWRERSAKGQSDGLLTALEVENLDLWGTELVVLSACETGLGQVQVGEGVLGLRRAFQLAGAQSVVASLWRVPDAETETLMADFLRRWLQGQGKAESLRAAQLELIRRLRASGSAARRQAPPLYWAGFICHGQAK